MIRIKIAAVGDLLMKSEIIASAKGSNGYAFDPIFAGVKPFFKKHDVTIGNLETTFSGNRKLGVADRRRACNCPRERRNPATGNPVFNCPDELAAALKNAGFHVLTTANNHSMDGGAAGLRRTLKILEINGLRHTGTFRSWKESNQPLIIRLKGVTIGILSYTKGTNGISVPKPWLVNRIDRKKIIADLASLKDKADFIIVCPHFGREFRTSPSPSDKQWMQFLFKQGVNVILGAHPHVLHPIVMHKTRDKYGRVRNRVAASSLGNFVSTRLINNAKTTRGMILSLIITKDSRGVIDVSKIARIPTKVQRISKVGKSTYGVTFM